MTFEQKDPHNLFLTVVNPDLGPTTIFDFHGNSEKTLSDSFKPQPFPPEYSRSHNL